ncbi:MAG TPA: hypothetical protein VJ837_01550, partial [Candidatus Paceibacterota bacterium]|nr:hypothetical protein [Candidatus Paceibacterota bacterium]
MEQVQAPFFWLAYALTPALILLAFRFFEVVRWRIGIALAIVLTLIASTPQYLAYSLLIVASIGLVELYGRRRFLHTPAIPLRQLAQPMLVLTGTALLFVALNFCWILPLLTLGGDISPGYAPTTAQTSLFSANSTVLNVLRGYDQWIYWYEHDAFLSLVHDQRFVANSLIVPFTALATMLLIRGARNRETLTVLVIAVLFGIAALGTNTPLTNWLVFDAPLIREVGWLLRVPGKMSYMLWVFYALMTAFFLTNLRFADLGTAAQTSVIVLLAASTALSLAPKVIRYFGHYYVPLQIPNDYKRLEGFLSERVSSERVLYVAPYKDAFGRNALQFETSFTWNRNRVAAATPVISSPTAAIDYYHLTFRDWEGSLYPSLDKYLREDEATIPLDQRQVGRQRLGPAGVK